LAEDEAKFRRRLLAMTLVRLAGLTVALLGVAVFYTGLLRPGGWPQVGAILIVLGTIDSLFAPMLLKRQWDKEER
jgi:thiol:disulfide interchange protein